MPKTIDELSESEEVDEGKLATKVHKDIAIESDKMRPNLKKFIIPILRRATYRWKPRQEAYTKARKERGKYECANCHNLYGPKEIDMDHVHPVVPLKEGFTDLNAYIDRLLPEVDGWQVLCKTCHMAKTTEEDHMRAFYNHERKDSKKKKKGLDK